MSETISQPTPADPSPAQLLRAMLCTLCGAPPGRQCTVVGPPGDHLARFVTALDVGLLAREDLAAIIGGLTVIADHVVIQERSPAATGRTGRP
jgi:hypothetical protein